MSSKRDYYEVLELDRNASESEIKKAYRKQAMRYHPDRNLGDKEAEAKFKEGAEAFEVLSNPDKKQTYDQFGHAGLEGAFRGGGFQWTDFTHAGDFSDIFENLDSIFGGGIFGHIFGGGKSARQGPPRGEDLRVSLELTLEEIAKGVQKKIRINRLQGCDRCGGTGSEGGKEPETCSTCGGIGQVRQATRSIFGQSMVVTTCPTCRGEGRVVESPCDLCGGEGRVRGTATLSVNIPAGVASGNYLPIRGQGNVGLRGGPPGDCIIFTEEKPHDLFERHGNDVIYDLAISFSQAALGDETEVPTLTGQMRLKIPPGTQSGKIFRIRGKGIPDVNGYQTGDELVRVMVWTPTKLSKREEELFQELSGLDNGKTPASGKGLFEKMKGVFG